MFDITTVPRLPQAVEEIRKAQYDFLVLTEDAEECQLTWFQSQLRQMANPPLILCLLTEKTQGVRDSLSADGIPFHGLAELSAAALAETASAGGSMGHAQNGGSAVDWERMLIGESSAMQHVREIIRLVASRTCTVLISGESGTGKEVVARALHLAGDRANREMVSVNCAAVPSSLLESEMFGHEKGAFTGALQTRCGRFEQAHQSTIFLDEIGDMPLELQAKILRVLQEKEVQRIGGSSLTRVDVRVLAATNKDLQEELNAGRFRHDLYFRLRVVPLHIPPLRERPNDIPPLVDHFLETICRREGIACKRIGPGVLPHLAEQPWPGNVRELQHALERAIALSGDREVLDLCDFPPLCDLMPVRPQNEPQADVAEDSIDFDQVMAKLERALIDEALRKSQGNKARAAQMLGLKRSTLVSKVKAFQAYSG